MAHDNLPLSRRDVLGLGIAGASSGLLGLGGCAPCAPRTDFDWNNAIGKDGVDAANVLEPKSLHDIQGWVRQAEGAGLRIRMTGSGHSFSDVAYSEDYLLKPPHLTRVLTLDRTSLRADAPPHLVRVESGISIRKLNAELAKMTPALGLENMGGWDAQTIAGAASTGTHGSGLKYGPTPSQIASLQIVGAGGKIVQLEPKDGITEKFGGFVETPEGRKPAELVQDDRLFHAATVAMGSMGIIYAAVLRVEPQFWLREKRTLTTWGAIKKDFIPRVIAGDAELPDYYEVYFNPYPSKWGQAVDTHKCILCERTKLTEKPANLSRDCKKRGTDFDNFIQWVGLKFLGKGTRIGEYVGEHHTKAPSIIDQGLGVLVDSCYTAEAPKVFNLGIPNEYRAYAVELAFDLDQAVAATEKLCELAHYYYKEEQLVHVSPPSLRFVAASPQFLAPSYGRKTATIEIGALLCLEGADALLEQYQSDFTNEFLARPHWGLDPMNFLKKWSQVRKLWGENAAAQWRDAYLKLNPNGTFDGDFTDRLEIRDAGA